MENMMMKMPKMIMGQELEKAMLVLPSYDKNICKADQGTRLIALNNMADIYLPSSMSYEIYSKIYLAMLHSLKKKETRDAVKQRNQNYRMIQGLHYNSVLGGADSFAITGPSGIGKSTALMKSIVLSGGTDVIATEKPYVQMIPCVNVQCPHDCSVKGILLEILSQVDMAIGTRYYQLAVKNRASIDNLIGTVSMVALNNILLIVIDECQNICRNKNGVNLVSAMTQLINSSGVSICMVGLPETETFFRQEMQLARRTIGLSYSALPCDDYFVRFCETLFTYQYVSHPAPLTPGLIELLYECSAGVIAILVSLVMEAQQIAILSGKEMLGRETILLAYQKRLGNVQEFIQIPTVKRSQTSSLLMENTLDIPEKETSSACLEDKVKISDMIHYSKMHQRDITEVLRSHHIILEEVSI